MSVPVFTIVCFFIQSAFIIAFLVHRYVGTPGLEWYIQHALETLRIVISEFIGQPMLIVGRFLLIINALVLGLAIDFAPGHPKKNSQFGGHDEDHLMSRFLPGWISSSALLSWMIFPVVALRFIETYASQLNAGYVCVRSAKATNTS